MSQVNRSLFEKNGYLMIKSLFSLAEIETFREKAYEQMRIDKEKGQTYTVPHSKATYSKGDLLSKENMRQIVLDERVIKIVREILGENIVYFSDGSFQTGVGVRGYHRDNVDRKFNIGPDWEGDYDIIRFGLYLQDHKKFSGGLKVRIGSHMNAGGKSVILPIEPGDLVVWNLRLLHSGNAVRMKLLPDLPVDYGERFVPSFLKKDEEKERIACFFSYARPGKHLDRYFNSYMLKTPSVLNSLKDWRIPDNIREEALKKGVKVINPVIDSADRQGKELDYHGQNH